MAKNSTGRVFPTKYDESVEKGTFETFSRPSMTEPDNAMSIPEIIARFTRGYGVQVPQHPWTSGSAFDGDGDPNNLDEFMEVQQPAPTEQPVPTEQPASTEKPAPTSKQEGS